VIINRHNYEELFLLYVDKELDDAQQIAVEEFVQQNPDLGKELDLLKRSILTEDEVRFEAKEILYKKEAGISLTNYEEYFLLLADKELSDNEMAEVEKFVLKHPQLQEEYTLLQQTILTPETIKFTHKEALYRTEKKRRVIPFTLIKMGVAAAVTGLVAALWIFTQNDNALNNNNLATKHEQAKNYSKPSNITHSSKAEADQPVALTNEKDTKGKIAEKAKRNTSLKQALKDSSTLASTTTVVKQITKKDLPKNDVAVAETPKSSGENLSVAANETKRNLSSNSSSKTVNENAAKTTFAVNQNADNGKSFAKEAVYNEINNDDEDRSLYIGTTEINKNKLRGLLKRATNFLDKKGSNNDTERTVQIASFKIKSK